MHLTSSCVRPSFKSFVQQEISCFCSFLWFTLFMPNSCLSSLVITPIFYPPMPHSFCTLKSRRILLQTCICNMANIWCQPLTLFPTHNKHFFTRITWIFQKVLKIFIPMGEILMLISFNIKVPQDVNILIKTKVLGVYMQMKNMQWSKMTMFITQILFHPLNQV